MTKLKGLPVSVYRDADGHDCTNGGVSGRYNRFILVDDSIKAPFEVKEDEIYLVVVRRILFGSEYLHCEPRMNGKPLPGSEGMCGPMMGGNYVKTSDSRFPNKYPIAIHDRYETYEVYRTLST